MSEPSDEQLSRRDEALARVLARRERHRHRAKGIRILTAAGGFVLAVPGLVLAIPLPELGIPLLLVGLSLLALEFDWAARAYARVVQLWEWLKALPSSVKLILAILAVTGVIALVVWLL